MHPYYHRPSLERPSLVLSEGPPYSSSTPRTLQVIPKQCDIHHIAHRGLILFGGVNSAESSSEGRPVPDLHDGDGVVAAESDVVQEALPTMGGRGGGCVLGGHQKAQINARIINH